MERSRMPLELSRLDIHYYYSKYWKHAITIIHFLKICHYIPLRYVYEIFFDQTVFNLPLYLISPPSSTAGVPAGLQQPAARLLPGRHVRLAVAVLPLRPRPCPVGKGHLSTGQRLLLARGMLLSVPACARSSSAMAVVASAVARAGRHASGAGKLGLA